MIALSHSSLGLRNANMSPPLITFTFSVSSMDNCYQYGSRTIFYCVMCASALDLYIFLPGIIHW